MNTIFIISILVLFYTFIGYPLILLLLVNRKSKNNEFNVPVGNRELTITAVIIACNEESVIKDKITNILSFDYPAEKLKVIIVDDASTDDTVSIIQPITSDRIKLLSANKRSGKASGLNMAMQHVTSDLVLMLDARQSVLVTAAKDLASWFEQGEKVGAVSGELQFKKEGSNDTSEGIDGYWRYEKLIRKAEAKLTGVPGVTGAIYMMRTSLYQPIPADTILDDVLIPMNISAKGYWVGFDERAIAWDIPSNDLAKEKSRKTRTIKGNYQLWLRNISFSMPFCHPIWCQYMSHKVLRIIAPYIAIVSLVTSLILGNDGFVAGYYYAVLFIVGIMMFPISLIFPNILKQSLLRLWISFVALNWFNMLGLYHYVFDKKQQAWK